MSIEEIFTTIQISKNVHTILESRKTHKRESFNDVLERVLVQLYDIEE